MSFHNVLFPPEISYGATGGPSFMTVIATATRSKKEWRDIVDEEGAISWNVAPGCTDKAKLDALIAFIRCRYGRAYSFRFKDWSDFEMTRQSIGFGDGGTTEFQIVKTYTDGTFSVTRDITKPQAGTVEAWINGASTTAFSLDALTGLITFDTAPGAGLDIEIQCEFDIPVRFEKDALKINLANFDHYKSAITVREVFGE